MFGLSKQVPHQILRLRLYIAEDEDFTGSGHRIDPHHTINLPFGLRHPSVARSGYFLDVWNAFRTVGQGADGLGAPDGVDLIHVQQGRGGHDVAMGQSVPARWGGQNDPRHAGDLGRNHVHQQRGGINRPPTGNINTHPLHRRYAPSQHGSIVEEFQPAVLPLPLVEPFDIFDRLNPYVLKRRIEIRHGTFEIIGGHPQVCRPYPIELLRIVPHRRIAEIPHARQDFTHRRLQIARWGRKTRHVLQISLRVGEDANHGVMSAEKSVDL